MKAHAQTMVPDVKEAVEKGAESGSWSEVLGPCAEELFSAYYVAGYVNAVAAAGKEAYPLPMTANCWLDKGDVAGKYPSGGPVSRVMEVWQYCAPNIDVIAPDIYVPSMIVKESEDTFYILVNGAGMGYFSTDENRPNVDVLSLEESIPCFPSL